MPAETDDFSKRIKDQVKEQIKINKAKKAAQETSAKGPSKFDPKSPQGKAVLAALVVLVLGAVWYAISSSGPVGPIRLESLKENVTGDKAVLVGKVNNQTGSTVKEKTWQINYLDSGNKPVVSVNLSLTNIKNKEVRDFTLELPGWKEGLRRVVKTKE